jgi:anti-sigma factor RsiW
MNCSEVEEKLLLDMSGELGPEDKARLDRHLAGCGKCRSFADSTRRLLGALGPAPSAPEALETRTLTAVSAWSAGSHRASRMLRLARGLGVAAAAAAAALFLLFLLTPAPKEPTPAPPAAAKAEAPQAPPTEQTAATREEVSQAISRIGTSSTKALDSVFAEQVEQTRDNVEAMRFMLTTADKNGLEREISTVKGRIQKLKDEMTTLALYTGPEQQGSMLDNGR